MTDRDLKVLSKDRLKDSFAVVIGTRPGIIKLSPVIRALQNKKADFFLAHTGQHYSYNMDKAFFEDLELPAPKYRVDITREARHHGAQTAEMLKGLEEIFLKETPGTVIVIGDANTNLAGALAARKLGLRLVHIEAGLRSNDWRMPEEHNRVIMDHISEFLFAPTEEARDNLVADNVKGEILVVGNTVVDAVYQNIELAKRKSDVMNRLELDRNGYFLLTSHREENVDHKETFGDILMGIKAISERYGIPILFPVHPRTRKRIAEFGLQQVVESISHLTLIDPVGYLDFLMLLSNARLVLSDSGGIQEESCILKIPCVTLRDNTERPETVKVGANEIGGTKPEGIVSAAENMLARQRDWENPFGGGDAAHKIIDALLKR